MFKLIFDNNISLRNITNTFLIMAARRFPLHKIENFSDFYHLNVLNIPVIKNTNYFVDDTISIDGDAPKKFIGIYDYHLMAPKRKRNHKNWIRYIAKTGQKWYPIESITELLLNRLGTISGLKMSESRLVIIGGQLRFLSRYFLNSEKEELIHGADILAGFLNESIAFVEEVDRQKLTREFFTLQVIEEAISNLFLHQKDVIMKELIRLLLFDALVGNNDRHFFNWGIVKSISNEFQPYFSPVYDTARGLFWNYSEKRIRNIIEINKNVDDIIRKYCINSKPKIGWEGIPDINHFQLFINIYKKEYYISRNEIKSLLLPEVQDRMFHEIKSNFSSLMSENRLYMIYKCLEYRFNEMRNLT